MKLLVRFTYLCCCGFLLTSTAYAQAERTTADTTARDSLPGMVKPPVILLGSDFNLSRDSLLQTVEQAAIASVDSARADSGKPPFKIFPWKYNASQKAQLASTDSTLRWQVWPNWIYKKNRDPGVITYRLGTIGRTNAFLMYSHEPRHQQLLWEDVTMNDPVSGTVNWDVIPLQKIRSFYEEDEGINYVSSYFLKQFYLSEPLSQLVYRESKFDMRSLEFIVSRNFGSQTNAEISYWDRRDGGEYPNSEVGGRQIFARIFHQLDHRQAVKVHFLNNNYTIGEPFGYGITDLSRFAFNHFQTSPQQASAESEIGASNFSLNYYRRSADTTNVSADDFRAGLFFNSRKRSLTYNVDSTYYKVQSIGVNAHKWVDLDPLQIEGSVSSELFINGDRERSDLAHGNWNLLQGKASAVFRPFSFFELSGGGEIQRRSDGFESHSVHVGSEIRAGKFIRISAGVSQGTLMPTPQHLYWSSLEYQGNPDLANEKIKKANAKASLDLFDRLTIGVKGQLKDIEDGIMITGTEDSTFSNVAPYNSASASAFFDYNSNRFELSGSATYHQFGHFIQSPSAPLPMDGNRRVWLKGGAYIKGYLFDRATYVKAGLAGMLSLFPYQAGHYNPVLDYWQPVSDDQYLPWFSRLDLDVSARVRSLIITLRWENVLDDVSQLGYFETAQYPMGQRRFIFGIRAFFRN